MKFKSLKLAVAAVAIGALPVANASLLIEPHVAYNLHGKGSNTDGEHTYNGAQYGLKVGYQSLGFMVGLDYNKSSYDLEVKSGGTTDKSKMSRNEIGVFAGYDFPILARAWAGYYFHNKAKADGGDFEYSGNTKEIGVGFKMLPLILTSVNLNFIYRMVDIDEAMSGSVKSKIDLSHKEYVIGISLPFTL